MRFAFVVAGAIVLVLSVLLGVNPPREWSGILWILFYGCVLVNVGLGLKVEHDNKKREEELNKSLADERAARTALSQATTSLESNLRNFGAQVTVLQHQIEEIALNPTARQLQELQNKYQEVLRSYDAVTNLYSQESKRAGWPYGAHGADYPGLHSWFLEHLPEAGDLTGEDRFFLFLLIKHGGEVSHDALRELHEAYTNEFPGIVGPPALSAGLKLARFGFLEGSWPNKIKLAEPYRSRLRNVELPGRVATTHTERLG